MYKNKNNIILEKLTYLRIISKTVGLIFDFLNSIISFLLVIHLVESALLK
jgi:hypothetical protein